MGVATPMATATAAMKDLVEDSSNINPRSRIIHSLTKRSPLNPKTLPLLLKPLKLTPFAALEAKFLITLKMVPTALKKVPLVLKKGSLPIQKVLKTVPLALKKGSLPIQKAFIKVPVAVAGCLFLCGFLG